MIGKVMAQAHLLGQLVFAEIEKVTEKGMTQLLKIDCIWQLMERPVLT